jgi:ABC-type multidrug transport system ATPase subunit
MGTGNSIEVSGLSKSYGKVLALDDISFNVAKGELFGLIGPDGAGKTTLFRLLTTLLNPDKGTASVEGLDIVKDYRKIRNISGYMPGKFSLYQELTVGENIDFFASIFGVTLEENYDLIKPIYVQIEPFKDRRAGALSGGMKQKLALCCALIHKPSVLFLDEPTTGVDAVSRTEFWDMLSQLKSKGITILASTPYMDEAKRCDRIALINNGKILQIDTPDGIEASFDQPIYAVSSKKMFDLLKAVRKVEGVESCYPFGEFHHAVVRKGFDAAAMERMLKSEGFDDVVVKPAKAGIEDVFIKLMGHE